MLHFTELMFLLVDLLINSNAHTEWLELISFVRLRFGTIRSATHSKTPYPPPRHSQPSGAVQWLSRPNQLIRNIRARLQYLGFTKSFTLKYLDSKERGQPFASQGCHYQQLLQCFAPERGSDTRGLYVPCRGHPSLSCHLYHVRSILQRGDQFSHGK